MVTQEEVSVALDETGQRLAQLERLRRQQREVASEGVPERTFGGGVSPADQQLVIQRRQTARENIESIKQEEAQLLQRRSELIRVSREIRGRSRDVRATVRRGIKRKNEFISRVEAAGLSPQFKNGEVVGFVDNETGRNIRIDEVAEVSASDPRIADRFEQAGIKAPERITIVTEGSQGLKRGVQVVPPSTVTAAEQEKGLIEGTLAKANARRREIVQSSTSETRSITKKLELTAIGGATAVLGNALFLKSIVTQPIQTVKGIPTGIKETTSFVRSGELAKLLRREPEFVVGVVATDLLLAKGSQRLLVQGPPVLRSVITRIQPSFKKVTKIESGITDIKIQVIPKVGKSGDIGLIPAGSPNRIILKTIPKDLLEPTVKGAFGFSQEAQRSLRGLRGITTSQRGLIQPFRNVALIKEIEPGLGLFGTPAGKFSKIQQTRVSRLGDLPKPASFRDILEGDFTIKGAGQPQIISFPQEIAGRRGGFEIITPTSELEFVTKSPLIGGPSLITDIKKVGVTVIGVRRVPIFEAKLGPVLDIKSLKGLDLDFSTAKILGKKGTSTLPTQDIILRPIVLPTGKLETSRTTTIKSQSINITPSRTISIKTRSLSLPTFRSPALKTPKSSLSLPPINRGGSPIRQIPLPRAAPAPIIRPPTPPTTRGTLLPPIRPPTGRGKEGFTRITGRKQGFKTFVIRGGQKITLPGVRPRGKALKVGALKTQQTLGATFGIEKAGVSINERDIKFRPSRKQFRTFRIREGKQIPLQNTFIQRREKRLSSRLEVGAIQTARFNFKPIKI